MVTKNSAEIKPSKFYLFIFNNLNAKIGIENAFQSMVSIQGCSFMNMNSFSSYLGILEFKVFDHQMYHSFGFCLFV